MSGPPAPARPGLLSARRNDPRARHADVLADAGLLHVFDVKGERAYRHWHCGPMTHQHLICDRCGQVAECPSDMVARWLVQLHHHTGFSPHPDGLDLYGVCEACDPDP
ncbi:transcriptional repressor [Micromonosporaceae bacterium B7E4]